MDHDWCCICGNRTENNSIYCSDTCSLIDQLNAELSASTVTSASTAPRRASVNYHHFSANSTPSRTLFNSPLRHHRTQSACTPLHSTSLTRASVPSLLNYVRESPTVEPTFEHLHRLTSSLEGQRRGELRDLRLNHDQQNRKNPEGHHRHQSHDRGDMEMGQAPLGRRELHASDIGLPSNVSDVRPRHRASFSPLYTNDGFYTQRHPSAARGIPHSPSDDPEQQQGLLPQRRDDSSLPSLRQFPDLLLDNPARILFATTSQRHNPALSPLTPRSPSISTPTTTTLPSPASTPASTPPPDPPCFFPPTATEPADCKEIEAEHRVLLERRRRRFERVQSAEAILAQWAERLGEVNVGYYDDGDFVRRRRVSAPSIRGLESMVSVPPRTSTSEPSAADMYNLWMLS
ncbi:hypothetical protein BJ742DRAFT_322424 [Cladochytrium replicatum]|nr:hypothetical protein BJ742DRAFT_322424 [Cladochytrium replicatum]